MKPVSIVITAYFEESKKYLDTCIESIRNLDYHGPIEIIIVGKKGYLPSYEGCLTIAPERETFFPPIGLNFGIKHASHELLLVLNDDTILTKNSLKKLVEVYTNFEQIGLLMPISNDQQGKYTAIVGRPPGPMKLEDVNPLLLMNLDSPYPIALSYHETLCIYAFLISKKVYKDIGPFDENLINGDDIDYTLRLTQKGYLNAINYNAIIYHFGGVSADKTFTPQIRKAGDDIFRQKWSGK